MKCCALKFCTNSGSLSALLVKLRQNINFVHKLCRRRPLKSLVGRIKKKKKRNDLKFYFINFVVYRFSRFYFINPMSYRSKRDQFFLLFRQFPSAPSAYSTPKTVYFDSQEVRKNEKNIGSKYLFFFLLSFFYLREPNERLVPKTKVTH